MHLVINASELGRQRGGNEAYLAGLLEGLADLPDRPAVSLLTCQWGSTPSWPATFQSVNLGSYRRLPFLLWQQTQALLRLKADWYLSTYFLPPVLPCRGAVVVHDVSFRAHPEYYPRLVAWYMHWLTGWAVRRARRVITISEFSRRQLQRFYPVGDKVRVILMGVGREFRLARDEAENQADLAILARYAVMPPFILALGNIHPRKNLARLLEAHRSLRRRCESLPPMVWVGLQRWGSGDLLTQARAAGVELPGFVAQADLPAFYRQAAMLVYPSLYEGFGLPPIEAMACGTPVVASNTTALPEAVGSAGVLVDPYDPAALADGMERVWRDAELRRCLRRQGLDWAQTFRWSHTARGLLDVLED